MKKAELEAEVARLRAENENLKGQLTAKQAALDSVVAAALAAPKPVPTIQLAPVAPHVPGTIIPNPIWINPDMQWPWTSFCVDAQRPTFEGKTWVGETRLNPDDFRCTASVQ